MSDNIELVFPSQDDVFECPEIFTWMWYNSEKSRICPYLGGWKQHWDINAWFITKIHIKTELLWYFKGFLHSPTKGYYIFSTKCPAGFLKGLKKFTLTWYKTERSSKTRDLRGLESALTHSLLYSNQDIHIQTEFVCDCQGVRTTPTAFINHLLYKMSSKSKV